MLRGKAQEFIEWTKLKIRIHLSDRILYFRKREIWWASLGANIGYEQDGKNANFERPILILQKFSRHVLWVIPLSTRLKDNPYYYQYQLGRENYSAILIQLRLISSKRLLRKIGVFPSDDFQKIKQKIKDLI